MEIQFLPYYSVNPRGITIFEMPDHRIFSEHQKNVMTENFESNENLYNELSEMARKRLQSSVDYMIYLSTEKTVIGKKQVSKNIDMPEITVDKGNDFKKGVKYKLTFVTLTLSAKQEHTDEEIKNVLLNQFLLEMKKKFKVDMYIWKAEKQENGNIHFHILTNKFIHHQELRYLWNRIQNKIGYVDKYTENMKKFFASGFKSFPNDKRPIAQQKKAYEANLQNGFKNPNSTDIHALYKIKNVSAYMTKYLTKDVTKTSRVQTMKKLYEANEAADKLIDEIDKVIVFMEAESPEAQRLKRKFDDLINEKFINTKELNELKAKGVSGRIWGQSQFLSKITNFCNMEAFENIPDIEIIQKEGRFIKKEVGPDRWVRSYYFDITHTPKLKNELDTHLSKTLYKNLV